MGKLLTVKAGYSGVLLPNNTGSAYNSTTVPQVPGLRNYPAGAQVTVTDAEYAAFPAATLAAVTVTTSGLPDPYRVASSVVTSKDNVNSTVGGAGPFVANVGDNIWTVTSAITSAITVAAQNLKVTPVVLGPTAGSTFKVAFYLTYTTTSGLGTSSTVFPTASWKFAGGTAPTWSTTAGYLDYIQFATVDGGTTFREIDRSIGIH